MYPYPTYLFFVLALSIILPHPAIATPEPLSISNHHEVRGTAKADQVQAAFTNAEKYLHNLLWVLTDTSAEAIQARDIIIDASFGRTDHSQLLTLQSNVNRLLGLTLPVPNFTPVSSRAVASYRFEERDVVFTNHFYTLRAFCQGLIVIHEAVHAMLDNTDVFVPVLDRINKSVVWLNMKRFKGPHSISPGSTLIYGYEHAQLDLVKRYGGARLTLLNPDSYASAAYRATLIREHGVQPIKGSHQLQALYRFEECRPGEHVLEPPVVPPSAGHPK